MASLKGGRVRKGSGENDESGGIDTRREGGREGEKRQWRE